MKIQSRLAEHRPRAPVHFFLLPLRAPLFTFLHHHELSFRFWLTWPSLKRIWRDIRRKRLVSGVRRKWKPLLIIVLHLTYFVFSICKAALGLFQYSRCAISMFSIETRCQLE